MSEDAAGLLLLMDEVLKSGFEGDTFVNGLAKHLRYLLYAKQMPTQSMLQMSDQLKERYIAQSEAVGYKTIITALDIANESDLSYPKAKDKRLHIEIALLKMCYAGRKVSVEAPRSAPSAPQKKTADTTAPIKQAQHVASAPTPPPAPAPPRAPAPSHTTTVQESTPMKVVPNDPPEETSVPAVVPGPEMTPVIKEETKVPQTGFQA